MFEKDAEELFKKKPLGYEMKPELEIYTDGFNDGYNKAKEWQDVNTAEPSKEQLGKQLLIRMESVTGDTDYDYLVYKYTGESITDVPGILAWKEID